MQHQSAICDAATFVIQEYSRVQTRQHYYNIPFLCSSAIKRHITCITILYHFDIKKYLIAVLHLEHI